MLRSTTRVWEEAGVGSGEFEGVLLILGSSKRSFEADAVIGGKEDEKTVGGRAAGLV